MSKHYYDELLDPSRDGRVLITRKGGRIINVRVVNDNEHVASFNALIDLAKLAGYKIVSTDGNTL